MMCFCNFSSPCWDKWGRGLPKSPDFCWHVFVQVRLTRREHARKRKILATFPGASRVLLVLLVWHLVETQGLLQPLIISSWAEWDANELWWASGIQGSYCKWCIWLNQNCVFLKQNCLVNHLGLVRGASSVILEKEFGFVCHISNNTNGLPIPSLSSSSPKDFPALGFFQDSLEEDPLLPATRFSPYLVFLIAWENST